MVSPTTIDRLYDVQLVFWLLKDMSWCMLFAEAAWISGSITLFVTWALPILENKTSSRMNGFACALWISGNFTWMLGETLYDNDKGPKLSINISNCPLTFGGLGDEAMAQLLNWVAVAFFGSALLTCCLFYCCCFGSYREELKQAAKQQSLLGALPSYSSFEADEMDKRRVPGAGKVMAGGGGTVDVEVGVGAVGDAAGASGGCSSDSVVPGFRFVSEKRGLVAYDNLHIVFWVCKDFFWGLDNELALLVFSGLGFASAVTTVIVGSHVSFLSNRHGYKKEMMEARSQTLWVAGNAIWMIGELFFNDSLRPFALVFFSLGVLSIASMLLIKR